MNLKRENSILYYIDKNGQGFEIGPSHSPVAPKKDGYNVHIIDHLDRGGLINKYQNVDENKYKNLDIQLSNIEEVDFVWNGQSYLALTKNSKFYDWIIASHIIEHTPDLIGFLCDCDAIMKNGGILSLVVPDNRYCFDRFRPITGISKIIDSYIQKRSRHSLGTAAEYYLYVVSKGEKIAWNKYHREKYSFIHSFEEVEKVMEEVKTNNEYMDFHSWCFTPSSFRLMIHDLHSMGFIPFKEVGCFYTDGFEFYITLGRKGTGIDISRMELLEQIQHELSFEFRMKCMDIVGEQFTYVKRKIKSYLRNIIK